MSAVPAAANAFIVFEAANSQTSAVFNVKASPPQYAGAAVGVGIPAGSCIVIKATYSYDQHTFPVGFQDSKGNKYTQLEADADTTSNGDQWLVVFVCENCKALSTTDNLEFNLAPTGNGGTDYAGYQCVAVPPTMVGPAPLLGSNINFNTGLTGAGTGNITSGTVGPFTGQVLLIGAAMMTSEFGTKPYVPLVDNLSQLANWFEDAVYGGLSLAVVGYVVTSSTSALQALFNSRASYTGDSVLASVVALQLSSAAQPFSGSASDVTTASAALTTQVGFFGTATDATSATGVLTGGAVTGFAADASDTTSGSATTTTWGSVVLTAPLYTGPGGICYSGIGWQNPPAVGDTIYFDPTFVQILADSEIVATVNNCQCVIQFNDGTGNAVLLLTIIPGNTTSGVLATDPAQEISIAPRAFTATLVPPDDVSIDSNSFTVN